MWHVGRWENPQKNVDSTSGKLRVFCLDSDWIPENERDSYVGVAWNPKPPRPKPTINHYPVNVGKYTIHGSYGLADWWNFPKKNLESGDSMRGQTLSPDRWVGHQRKPLSLGVTFSLTIPKTSQTRKLPGTWFFLAMPSKRRPRFRGLPWEKNVDWC